MFSGPGSAGAASAPHRDFIARIDAVARITDGAAVDRNVPSNNKCLQTRARQIVHEGGKRAIEALAAFRYVDPRRPHDWRIYLGLDFTHEQS
jgi:hypothetical protein